MGLDYFKKGMLDFIVDGSSSPHAKEQGGTHRLEGMYKCYMIINTESLVVSTEGLNHHGQP